MRTEYEVDCGFSSFRISVDLEQAPALISTNFDPDWEEASWDGTPYQTADARHDLEGAIRLVLEYCPNWYVDPSDPRSEEDQLDDLMGHMKVREI